MTNCIQILARFLCTLYFITFNIAAESDWLQECGNCKCKWSSGKKYADCKNNSLYRVPNGLSSELQVLDLSYNIITEIRKQEFSNANLQNLHKLFIRNCSLRDINRDGLKNLGILIEIDLSNNVLKSIHPGIFNGLVKLRTVIMNNNQIERLEDRTFDSLGFLHKIELKENRIHKISLNTFVNVPVLSQIYLDSNNLRILKRETFHNLEKLTSLSLSQNPWNCTCDLKHFRDFTIDKNLYTPPTDCYEPIHLRGKLWSDIPTDYFACKPKILIPLAGAFLDAYTDNVTLTCRIKGSPTPDVTWYYNKQTINHYERRYHIKKLVEKITRDAMETVTSELTIVGVKSADKGTYSCLAKNRGGQDQAEIILAISIDDDKDGKGLISLNLLLIICLVSVGILIFLILGLILRVTKRNKQRAGIENNSDTKIDRSQDDTGIESTPTMKEVQKHNVLEINPIEKPVRRAYVELNGTAVIERPRELNKIRLEETNFVSNENGTTPSANIIEISQNNQKFFINENCNSNLPPDLLTLPT